MNIDIGIANPTNSAFRKPKKNMRTATTKITPKMILFTKSSTWLIVVAEVSLVMVTSRSEGRTFSLA